KGAARKTTSQGGRRGWAGNAMLVKNVRPTNDRAAAAMCGLRVTANANRQPAAIARAPIFKFDSTMLSRDIASLPKRLNRISTRKTGRKRNSASPKTGINGKQTIQRIVVP